MRLNVVRTCLYCAVGIILSIPRVADAQVISSDKLAWDQPAPDLASAQAYTYKYYADAATVGVVLTSVTCVNVGTPAIITCQTAFPAFAPGAHSIQLTATNTAGEGLKSAPYNFTLVVVPSAPVNLRVVK